MTFAQPIWLFVGACVCAALVLLLVRAAHKRRAAVRLLAAASPTTSLALHRRILRDGLAVAGVALAFGALARPLGGSHLEAVPTRGVDLMFAVDTSKSMRASDIRPDRLTRAKLAVEDLAKSFDGARLGLIAFAGDAFVQAPMTADRGVFVETVDALDTDVIPRGGTDLSSAIRAAEQAMASEPEHHKVLVLVSDGEDLAGSAVDAARDAAAKGLTIYTVGVGSEEGSLIELTDGSGRKQLVRDEAGNPVRSHLDERTLRAIAQVTGGTYAPLGADGRGLAAIYADARAKLPATTAAGMQRRVYAERFAWPLSLAIACLLAELVIGDRRRRRSPRMGRLGLAALLVPAVAAAAPVGDYNAGTSAYRRGDFATADKQFDAALHTKDLALQEDAYYDLGNARYREGQATLAKQDRDATIASWKEAIAAYDAALALAPDDADAKFNRDFVARQLAALEQQQKPPNSQPQQKQGGQDQQQQRNQSGQGQQQQNQSGQGQQQQNQSGQGQQQQNQSGQGQQQQNQSGQGQQQQNQSGQGQQQQDKSGQAQRQQNQAGQGQKQQDQDGQGQQQQDHNGEPQQNQAGQAPQQQNQRGEQGSAAQAPDVGERAEHSGEQSIGVSAQQAARERAAADERADAARRAAGQLTRSEAVQLLDSLQHQLKPMPIRGEPRGKPTPTPIKDW